MRRVASLSLLSFFMPKPPPKRYSDLNFDLLWHAFQNVFRVSTSVICIQPQRMIALANGGNHIIPIPKFQATHMHKFVIHRFYRVYAIFAGIARLLCIRLCPRGNSRIEAKFRAYRTG